MNKINASQPPLVPSRPGTATASTGRVTTPEVAQVANPGAGGDRSSLELTSASSNGPVFNSARVDAIRNQLASGSYAPNVRAIANGLLTQSRDLQGLM